MKPNFSLDSVCEHCGELEPYTLTFDDGNCTWCEDCATEIESWVDLSKDEKLELSRLEVMEKISYFKGRLEELYDTENSLY